MQIFFKYAILMILATGIGNAIAETEHANNPIETQIARLLYSEKELAANNVRFFYRAWKRFPGRYIVATCSTYEPKGSDIRPIEIAVVQFNGFSLEVIARNIFQYSSGCWSENQKLEIDTANYRIAEGVTAFGLRTHDRYAGSGFKHTYESLDLFAVSKNKITHIVGNLSFAPDGLFSSFDENYYCNNGVSCDISVWSSESQKTILIVTSSKTGEYFDLLAKTTKTSKTGHFSKKGRPIEENVQTESSSKVFKWNGSEYQEN